MPPPSTHPAQNDMVSPGAAGRRRDYGSPDLRHVSGLVRTMPVTGGLFAAGTLALVGLPPFGIFLSKLAMLRAGFATGHAWLMAAVLGLLAVASVAFGCPLNLRPSVAPPDGLHPGEPSSGAP